MITYREFCADHMAEVLKIYESAGWTAYLKDDEKLTRAFKNSLYILGAFDGENLIGFVRCVGDGEHIVYVQDLIVDVEHKRQGIGQALLAKSMEKYADVRMFTLLTDVSDEVSNAFYRANKMLPYGECSLIGYVR